MFSNLASEVNWGLGSGAINAGGYIYTLPYLTNGLDFSIGSGATLGLDWTLTENGAATNDLSFYIKDTVPNPGSSTNGFYRDANGNGSISSDEARVFTGINNANLAATIDAQAVPEPTTMALAGLAGVALLRKRAKKA